VRRGQRVTWPVAERGAGAAAVEDAAGVEPARVEVVTELEPDGAGPQPVQRREQRAGDRHVAAAGERDQARQRQGVEPRDVEHAARVRRQGAGHRIERVVDRQHVDHRIEAERAQADPRAEVVPQLAAGAGGEDLGAAQDGDRQVAGADPGAGHEVGLDPVAQPLRAAGVERQRVVPSCGNAARHAPAQRAGRREESAGSAQAAGGGGRGLRRQRRHRVGGALERAMQQRCA
jgi:hypothetical protein